MRSRADGQKKSGRAAARAAFKCIGTMPTAVQVRQKRIVTEWLPNLGRECADAPDIEAYFEGGQTSPSCRCQVWLAGP